MDKVMLVAVVAGASVADLLKAADAAKAQGPYYPANGGTEVPFIARSGRRLLYVYQPSSGKHAYLDCGTDMILSAEEAAAVLA